VYKRFTYAIGDQSSAIPNGYQEYPPPNAHPTDSKSTAQPINNGPIAPAAQPINNGPIAPAAQPTAIIPLAPAVPPSSGTATAPGTVTAIGAVEQARLAYNAMLSSAMTLLASRSGENGIRAIAVKAAFGNEKAYVERIDDIVKEATKLYAIGQQIQARASEAKTELDFIARRHEIEEYTKRVLVAERGVSMRLGQAESAAALLVSESVVDSMGKLRVGVEQNSWGSNTADQKEARQVYQVLIELQQAFTNTLNVSLEQRNSWMASASTARALLGKLESLNNPSKPDGKGAFGMGNDTQPGSDLVLKLKTRIDLVNSYRDMAEVVLLANYMPGQTSITVFQDFISRAKQYADLITKAIGESVGSTDAYDRLRPLEDESTLKNLRAQLMELTSAYYSTAVLDLNSGLGLGSQLLKCSATPSVLRGLVSNRSANLYPGFLRCAMNSNGTFEPPYNTWARPSGSSLLFGLCPYGATCALESGKSASKHHRNRWLHPPGAESTAEQKQQMPF
jgi:hypothetical protein